MRPTSRVWNLLRLALYDWSKGMPAPKRAGLLLSMLGLGLGIGLLWAKASPAMGFRLAAFTLLLLCCLFVMNAIVASDLERKLELEREQIAAREIQKYLQGHELPQFPGCEIAGLCRTNREVGGDYFDAIKLNREKLLLVIADVSGKGIPAALLMANLQAILRTSAFAGQSPREIATSIHLHLLRHSEPERYVTAFLGLLYPASRQLTYVNAGHEPPLLASSEGSVTRLDAGGPPLGLIPEVVFETGNIALPPNSTLLLYTDGVTDRSNRRGEFYGVERLISHLNEAVPSRASDIVAYLLRASDAFAGSVPAADDLTLLVLRTAGQSSER
jgi:sigma-B regulation protein RsbU (phosphoserine phosphatase)